MTLMKDAAVAEKKSNAFDGYSFQYKMTTQASIESLRPVVSALLTLANEPIIFNGYMNGYRQPVAVINLRVQIVDLQQLAQLQQALNYYLQPYHFNCTLQTTAEVANCFATAIYILQKKCGLPIFEKVQIEENPNRKNEFIIWMPILFGICFHPIAAFLMKLCNYHSQQTTFSASEKLTDELNNMLASVKMHAPKGTNTLRFLQAAFEEKIPWRHVANNTFQYGYGKHSHWMDSTFTDKTAHIAAVFSENKTTISYILMQAGFPVVQQYMIRNEVEALTLADKLHYPVVIKPFDGHGGMGVFVNLHSAEEVKKAFHKTKKYTQNIALEKHIQGKDYRLLVMNGKMIWAIERIPATVIGDGVNTIQALIETHNQQYQGQYPLRHIAITEDIKEYLLQQGFSLTTIPAHGKTVTLSRIANVSAGGTPVGVFEKVHPDNQRLAEAAATLLRLDFVGIDFITPDIQQSYRVNGGKIIEVNAQPQLGVSTAAHLYRQVLTTLLPKRGSIPIIVIYGVSAIQQNYIAHLKNDLLNRYHKVGLARDNSIIVNNEVILETPSLFTAGQHLLAMHDLDILIFCVANECDIKNQGLPFEYYDYLIMLKDESKEIIRDTLLKACTGEKIILENSYMPTTRYTSTDELLSAMWNTLDCVAELK